ncbi:MAG: acetyl-CoA carboxylase biotin carboxyl carrier protein [Solirubrobacteraceae bacterium]
MSDSGKKSGNPDAELIASVWAEARSLMARLEGSSVQRLAVAAGGTSIEIERDPSAAPSTAAPPSMDLPISRRGSGVMPTIGAGALGGARDAAAPAGRQSITAPLVGTFYRSSTPGSDPFVEVGDIIEAGQAVGIVEAMKLMNEVQATSTGKVVQIVAEDGQAVEYEQLLMHIEPVDDE